MSCLRRDIIHGVAPLRKLKKWIQTHYPPALALATNCSFKFQPANPGCRVWNCQPELHALGSA